MERLTQIENDKLIMVKQDNGEYIPVYWDEDNFKAIEKLATYEDLEEQGLLVRLPDDLNRVLYQINYRWTECTEYSEQNNKCEIYDCKCECDSRKEYYIAEVGFQYISTGNYYDRLGKTIFLTREEAEKKLEEMKNGL